ncbi:MAG: CapA family protein [Clostridiales bacterium]|nr:CapA family protein [Clostridiales bacterium]
MPTDNWESFNIPSPYVFNLEYVPDGANYRPVTNKINLSGSSKFAKLENKPVAVNIANNHIMDFSEDGFEHTISCLTENGIKYFGAGSADDNYNNPCMISVDGKNIALLGYSDVYHSLESTHTYYQVARPTSEQIQKDINICKNQKADCIIVNVHWGREERPWYNKRQEALGHCFIDEGADIVIGHHTHCIQPAEIYKDKYIFYSLGNSYFPDIHVPSYYNDEGKPEFVMHKRHRKYGRESLSVVFDVQNCSVKEINKCEFKNGCINRKKQIDFTQAINPIYSNKFINSMTGYIRQLIILISGNIFVDGKLLNYKAFLKEFDFIASRLRKRG